MKHILPLAIGLMLWCVTSQAQHLFSLSFNDIDGTPRQMNSLTGKKILFIVLPASAQDTLTQQLITFSQQYSDSVRVIAVLAQEEGISGAAKQAIRNTYANSDVIVTEIMYVRKTSGEQQSPVLQWLTDKNKNHHYDRDASSAGMKYFVTTEGRLFAVMGPQTSLQSPIINNIMKAR